jgi:hypothetical protein
MMGIPDTHWDFRHPPSTQSTGIPDTHLRIHPLVARSFRANPGPSVIIEHTRRVADASGSWVSDVPLLLRKCVRFMGV